MHAPAPSSPIWAICTSATREYAKAALKSAGLPQPDVFVVAEDVKRGKPLYVTASRFVSFIKNVV